jgi:site-specific DNA-adenine methylase
MKSLKTPLRYPGGKSRACTKLDQFLPDLREYDEYREPFLGGGSVALHITKKYPHLKVWVNDLYEPLVNFWQVLQKDGVTMKNKLLELKTRCPDPASARVLFQESKHYLDTDNTDTLWRAVSFYIVNKCSFSGLTESSSFSKQASDNNFSFRGIEKLPFYSTIISKWHITNLTYEELFDESSERRAFIYLDPPYDIKDNLYGKKGAMHKRFDHDAFATDCDICSMDCLISYNANQLVKDRFKSWQAGEFDLTYTMRSVGEYMREQRERKELVLFNYGTQGLAQLNQPNQEASH